MIISLANILDKKFGQLHSWRDVLPIFIYVGVPFLLVLKQPDLGTSLVFIAILFGMLFVAGIPTKMLLIISGAGAAFMPTAAEGERIGKYLVGANLTGHDSHGVVRVPRYVQWKDDGTVVADRKVKIVTETPVLAVVDGQYGFGQTVAPQAVAHRHRQMQGHGPLAGGAAQRRPHRPGRRLGRNGGGRGPRLHPLRQRVAAACWWRPSAASSGASRPPRSASASRGPARPPIVLDFATSVVAEGKVLVASQGGKKLPDDALIGRDGKMSGDPHVLYGDYTPTGPRQHRKGTGAIRAFGDHKGSGLAFMCEMLGGSLTGTGATGEGRPLRATACCRSTSIPGVVDPEACSPTDVARYIAYFKSAKPAKPGGEVLVPGEPEQRTRRPAPGRRRAAARRHLGRRSSPPPARSASTSAASNRSGWREAAASHRACRPSPPISRYGERETPQENAP